MESKKIAFIVGGVLLVGGAAYLILKPKGKDDQNTPLLPDEPEDEPESGSTPPKVIVKHIQPPKPKNSTFPLELYSRGTLVKDIQLALMKKYPGVLPKFGADGHYGKELRDTLLAKGLPLSIDSKAYAKILADADPKSTSGKTTDTGKKSGSKNKPSAGYDPEWNAKYLAKGLRLGRLDYVLDSLKKIKGKTDYILTNEYFKSQQPENDKKTIVTAITNRFDKSEERKKISAALFNIGLRFDGYKWSLSGFGNSTFTP